MPVTPASAAAAGTTVADRGDVFNSISQQARIRTSAMFAILMDDLAGRSPGANDD